MKTNIRRAAIAVTIGLAASTANSVAMAATNDFISAINSFDYYVGVEVQNRYTKYHKGEGSRFMKTNVPEAGIFFGVQFNEYFGMEVGYEKAENTTSIGTNSSRDKGEMAGWEPSAVVINNDIFREYKHTIKYKRDGINLLLTGHVPILGSDTITAFGAAGVTLNKVKYSYNAISYLNISNSGAQNGLKELNRANHSLEETRKIYIAPTIKLGIEYNPSQYPFSIRLFGSFLSDSRDHKKNVVFNKDTVDDNKETFIIHPKNSFAYGIGLVYKI